MVHGDQYWDARLSGQHTSTPRLRSQRPMSGSSPPVVDGDPHPDRRRCGKALSSPPPQGWKEAITSSLRSRQYMISRSRVRRHRDPNDHHHEHTGEENGEKDFHKSIHEAGLPDLRTSALDD